ncbi:MAG: tryptophan-rich sensory protein [Synechococcales bacterium]|nr:tryptophan-rich sensory protein [Synechococcales bacterium]
MSPLTRLPNSDLLRQIIVAIAIITAFAVNVWSNLFPINGETIGEISNTLFRDVLITPANYAFIIWGVIYLGLFSFAAYQLRPAQRQNPRLRRSAYWLVVACVAQTIWVFLFLSRQFVGSLLLMLVILLALIALYLGLGIGTERTSAEERLRLQLPISIYLGWISVATVVNVAIALYSLDWNGWGIAPRGWTAILIGVAALIAIGVLLTRGDTAYGGVFIWAILAIGVRQASQPWILGTAIAAVLVLAVLVARNWRVGFPAHSP